MIGVGQEYREPDTGFVWVVRSSLAAGVWHLTTKEEVHHCSERMHLARAVCTETLQKWERLG